MLDDSLRISPSSQSVYRKAAPAAQPAHFPHCDMPYIFTIGCRMLVLIPTKGRNDLLHAIRGIGMIL